MRRLLRTSLVASALVPSMMSAQGVVVQSTTDTHLMGGLGAIASFAARMGGGNMHDNHLTTTISGHKLKTESGNTATIIDADAGTFTTVDNAKKTYTTMTFAEMAAAMQQARQNMASQMNKPQDTPAADPNAPKGSMDMKYSVKVDPTGQHQKVAGFDAEHVFLTISIEGTAKPENGNAQQVGTMVLLIDQWLSKDAPQIAAMKGFQKAYMAKAGDAFRAQASGLQAAFASDARIKDGFDAAAKELAKMQGIALRSTTYVTLVPANVTFDRNLALGDASAATTADAAKKDDAPKSGGRFGGLMGAIKSAAAAKAGEKPDDKNTSTETPKQATLMTLTDQVTSIAQQAIPASAFTVPADYREVKPPMLRGK
ncbi:MAG: hypothetical protein ABI311_13035 [Gemmatimonadaceae bacterium]